MAAFFDSIISQAHERRASDIHIVRGLPIRLRIDGQLENLNESVMTDEDCRRIAEFLAGEKSGITEMDSSGTYGEGIRCRVNLFRQQGTYSAAIRLLSDEIPELESLGLPPVVYDFPSYPRGIVLVTGETGSGKSTTLAAILNRINHTCTNHIITLEDPIEYIYTPDKCVINQREIGRDTHSFADGLRASLREDPDVILVGEMRDLDTIETALTAAETGHLVFGTLHTNSAPDSIDRIVDVFPEARQKQIRLQLSMTLKAVISQQLLLRREGKGRVAACEVMIVNAAIRNLIREGKTPQIQNAMATSAAEGSITMDNQLLAMVKNHVISLETAYAAAQDLDYVKKYVRY